MTSASCSSQASWAPGLDLWLFRAIQASKATADQTAVAVVNASQADHRPKRDQQTSAKAIRPKAPMDAPVASRTVARRARSPRAPGPALRLCSLTMNAIPVGKIAGIARKRPPIAGPHFLATSPVPTVIAPPIAKRNAWPEILLSLSGPGVKRILTSAESQGEAAGCQSEPDGE